MATPTTRDSRRKEFREFEDHCRMMARKIDNDIKRVSSKYWLNQAAKHQATADEFAEKAERYRQNHQSLVDNLENMKVDKRYQLASAGVIKMILQMSPHKVAGMLCMSPKSAIQYFFQIAKSEFADAEETVKNDFNK